MGPDINPIYAGLERSCPRDSKNVSIVAFFIYMKMKEKIKMKLKVVYAGGDCIS